MHKPLVTVVTVTYNLIKSGRQEDFGRCLESVHNQTYKNIEHIIIDGASSDGTIELIKEYADKGWIKYISEPDTGIYDAMNKGASMAQGKYIIFLNSDDYFSGNEGIEKSVKALEETNADYSYSDCKIVDSDGVTHLEWHWQNKPSMSKVFTHMPFCHQTFMIKTETFKKMGMYDTTYKSAGDYEFVLRLVFNKFKYVYIPYEFVTFQQGGYSLSNARLSAGEVVDFYFKHYNKFCKLTFEECQYIVAVQYIPLKLLIKLLPYLDIENKKKLICDKKYFTTLLKNIRRSFFRLRFSKTNPSFIILGIRII